MTKRLAMRSRITPSNGEFEGVYSGLRRRHPSRCGIEAHGSRGWTCGRCAEEGDLKLTLNGFKLKGSWVLVRTKGRWAGTAGGGDRSGC